MKPLTVEEILSNDAYERERARLRKEAIEKRDQRRITLGDSCVVVFENRHTVQYQVQEMLRVERDDSPDRIALELSCFNLLIPGHNELSATLLIRVPEYREVDNVLQRLSGITRQCISLEIGGEPVYASFDVDEDTLVCDSDVFYIRFSMTAQQAAAFRNPSVSVLLRGSHEKCRAEVPIEGVLRASLIEDLGQ
jgi:hypothetical protein